MSCLAAVASDGLVAVRLKEGNVNDAVFFFFCAAHDELVAGMVPFDETRPSQSVLILDNARISPRQRRRLN